MIRQGQKKSADETVGHVSQGETGGQKYQVLRLIMSERQWGVLLRVFVHLNTTASQKPAFQPVSVQTAAALVCLFVSLF